MSKILKKILPKTAEEALIEASKTTQEKKNHIVEKHIEKISTFLDSEDAVPTQVQVLSRNTRRLEKLSNTAHDGKKPSISIGEYGGSSDYPLELALIILQQHADFILRELIERNIDPKEIEKGTEWRGKREKGKWTKQEIQNLPLDWVKSAVVAYYTTSEEKGKDDSCSKEKGVISASELKECEHMIKIGSVQ